MKDLHPKRWANAYFRFVVGCMYTFLTLFAGHIQNIIVNVGLASELKTGRSWIVSQANENVYKVHSHSSVLVDEECV
ncbi:unnamed protein product [Camellia sinensis]